MILSQVRHVMSREKDLARNTAVLTFGKICTQCISFLLLPLYTSILEDYEYGTFDLMLTYATLLIPLVNWQFDQGIFRFLLDVRNEKEKQNRLFSTVFAANFIHSLVFAVILMVVNYFIKINNFLFLILYVIMQTFVALFLQFARGIGRNKVYAMASFISASTTVILNVLTLTFFHMGLRGLFEATLFAQIIASVYLCMELKLWKCFNIKYVSKSIYQEVRRYSLPLIPNNLAWWIVNVSDRTIVSYVLGVAVNGIYTVANKFSNVFIQFYNIFNLSWTETVSLHYQDQDRDTFLSEMITTMYKLFFSACTGIVALMPFIFPLLVNEKYQDAYPQIIILMYAMLLRIIVGLYSSIYVATKESRKIAYTSAASAIINIVINLLFISKIGLYAASLSTFVAFGIMAIVRYVDINKTIHMKIDAKILGSSFVLAVLLMITYYMNQPIINLIMLGGVCLYALCMNWSIIVSIFHMGTNFVKKFKN